MHIISYNYSFVKSFINNGSMNTVVNVIKRIVMNENNSILKYFSISVFIFISSLVKHNFINLYDIFIAKKVKRNKVIIYIILEGNI